MKYYKKILPARVRFLISVLKNNYLDGYSLKSYSQEGEDMILRRLFEHQTTGYLRGCRRASS